VEIPHLKTSRKWWLLATAISSLIPYAVGAAYVAAVASAPDRTDWLYWGRLDAVVTMLVSVAGLTALVSVCLVAFAVRERSTAIKVSLCIGGLSLGLALAIAARLEATKFALNLVISEGGLSGLSSNPQGTYIAGELLPPSAAPAGTRVIYLDNANGVRGIANPLGDGCFATQTPSAGGEFGVFLDHHYWPLVSHVSRGYFRVIVTLRTGAAPNATMTTWERISSLAFINSVVGCRP
jgi:hypothetical protein